MYASWRGDNMLLFIYCCLKLSSECSRLEEKENYYGRIIN